MRKELFTINTAERKRILGRIFPNGYIRKSDPYEREDEETYLGYTPDNDIIELRFWFKSSIDFYFKKPDNRKKYEIVDELLNTALANNNKHKEYKGRHTFDFDSDTEYFIVYNNLGFTLCFRAKEEKKQTA